ncbi:MFS transporter [Pelomonas sp. Root1217]|uniref:MFS transporter n=1 Tax=Pelomonas sp. Root1217 TaxID=1736430 RepID=UPI00070F6D45|nr:MFS transporter [Pelomonas sp. Root1217]KQV50489.1 MFS transporter [Pelomonas sp. Root1217]
MSTAQRSPWAWVPTLYFAQGIPYVMVVVLSTTIYKNLGISNTEAAFFTSWIYLPWVIKPLWSPLVELFGRKRQWVTVLQFLIGAALASVALTIPVAQVLQWSLAIFWLIAFASASHDIAADGYYMLALPQHSQAAFVGVRSTAYRLANIGCQGGLVYLSGFIEKRTGSFITAWSAIFCVVGVVFLLLALWHLKVLPRPDADRQGPGRSAAHGFMAEFREDFSSYFAKPGIVVTLAFLLLYRFPEAQLLKLASPFLLDPVDKGGLGLSNQEVGFAYGTVGLIALTVGGLVGGWIISRIGLKKALWPLVLAMHVPNVAFLLLAMTHPTSLAVISAALAVEQFGYGLGFTAYLMYMIHVAEGEKKTAHYAICTGFMALGMMIPGMWSGWLQDHIGYVPFFAWVLVATLPSFIMAALIKVPDDFGKKVDA